MTPERKEQITNVDTWLILALTIIATIVEYTEESVASAALIIKLAFLVGAAVVWRADRREPSSGVVDGWFITMLVAIQLFGAI